MQTSRGKIRDLLQRIVINTNIYLENSDITAEQLRDKLKEELETLSAALKLKEVISEIL